MAPFFCGNSDGFDAFLLVLKFSQRVVCTWLPEKDWNGAFHARRNGMRKLSPASLPSTQGAWWLRSPGALVSAKGTRVQVGLRTVGVDRPGMPQRHAEG